MAKRTKLIFLFVLIILLLSPFCIAQAQEELTNVFFDIEPKTIGSNSTWLISFSIPKTSTFGYLIISLSGFVPDLSAAKISVTGLSNYTAELGKTNPNCSTKCDDIRLRLIKPVELKGGTNIELRLNNVKNPNQVGQSGLASINIYSSAYPGQDLAFSSGNLLVKLEANTPGPVVPPDQISNEINKVIINEQFYKEGSQSTKLSQITDPVNVQDFTLDLLGKVKVVFLGKMDLSTEKGIKYIANLPEYLTFNSLKFSIKKEFVEYFKLPLRITYYDLPFVGDADLMIDKSNVFVKKDIAGYSLEKINDKLQLTFSATKEGEYWLVPHFELLIDDNKLIEKVNNLTEFKGVITDPQAIVKISLVGSDFKDYQPQINPQDGSFSFTAPLLEGSNLIEATGESQFGQLNKITKLVEYKSPLLEDNTTETQQHNPLYFIVGALVIIAIILLFSIIYLVRKK